MMLSESAALGLATQLVERCRELATITDVCGETTRTFLSDGMRRANARVSGWMQEAGMQTRTDAAGNVRGVLAGGLPNAGSFVIASHLDTVPNAGAFDGPLGVLAGVSLAQEIGKGTLPFALEVIGFSEEEGVRFGVPCLGSRALSNGLSEDLLDTPDRNGVSVREAMRLYGLPLEMASGDLEEALGYLEFHIEQGPQLDDEGLPVAVVETIAGQSRFQLTFKGKANHAGTTPMGLRHDALCAAASTIVAVEEYAKQTGGLVATVGSIHAEPNAGNVIPGEVSMSLDVRSASESTRADAAQHLLSVAHGAAKVRGVSLQVEQRTSQATVPMDPALLRLLENSVEANSATVRRIASGAGHDAMIVAPHLPAAMLFLRSPGGVSHHPDESVHTEDVALALRVGYTFLHTLAAQNGTGAAQ